MSISWGSFMPVVPTDPINSLVPDSQTDGVGAMDFSPSQQPSPSLSSGSYTCSSSSQLPSPVDTFFQCPFRGLDDCKNGKDGRGLGRGSLVKHLSMIHYRGDGKAICRERIIHNTDIFHAWEEVLSQLQMWLCPACMRMLAWSTSCRLHDEIILAPSRCKGAHFLIHGIKKPAANAIVAVNGGEDASVPLQPSLTLDLLDTIFRKQVNTVSYIPPKCRLQVSRAFKASLDKVIHNPKDPSVWIQLLLFPVCILQNFVPKPGWEEKSGMRKKLQVASINQAIAQWLEPNGCVNLVQSLLDEDEHVHTNKQPIRKLNQEEINMRICRKKIGDGLYTAAIRVLTSSGVAPQDSNTLSELIRVHPHAPPPSIPHIPIAAEAFLASKELVLGRIKSFPRGTSCGRDGLRAQHLLDMFSGAATAVAEELLTSITDVVNLLLAGKCPLQLGVFFASAPLTPLIKPGGGIRPIAVGTIWRRLVSKVAATAIGKEMGEYLGDLQFGVGVSCGGEAILHSVNRLLEVKGNLQSMTMLLVDFRNAFNLVDRTAMIHAVRNKCPSISRWVEFCYLSPARLYFRDSILSSAQGVQQGDPLGPLLFALTLHPLATKIANQCCLDLHAWYLDDGTLIGDTLQVSKALNIIQEDGPALGLHLNIAKTEIFWPSHDTRSMDDGVFPPHIGRPSTGVKLLGGPVSLDSTFCHSFVLARVEKTINLMDAIQKLNDPQSELLLLRNCTGVSRLYFTMRTTKPSSVATAQPTFDSHLFKYMRHLITGDGPGFGLLQQRLVSLPIRDGGLGIYTMEDTQKYCFLASCLQTKPLQDTILRNTSISGTSPTFQQALDIYIQACGTDSSTFSAVDTAPHPMSSLAVKYFDAVKKEMPATYMMSTRDLVLWQCNKTKHAQDYLLAIPIVGLNQKMGPRQFSSVLCYRLGIPLFPVDDLCSSCRRKMDIFGDHALHCATGVGIKFRHDLVRDTLADMCSQAGVPARKEVSLGFLSEDGGELRPADILVYNWDNGRDICFDVTGVSPFTGGGVSSFTPGLAVANAETRKRNKYLDKCKTNGYGLGILSFTTLGELGDDTVDFLKRLKNFAARHVTNAKMGNFIFNRLGITIQKGIGAQLVARLPTSFLKLS